MFLALTNRWPASTFRSTYDPMVGAFSSMVQEGYIHGLSEMLNAPDIHDQTQMLAAMSHTSRGDSNHLVEIEARSSSFAIILTFVCSPSLSFFALAAISA